MRRPLVAVLSAVAVALLAAGCGSSGSSTATTATTPSGRLGASAASPDTSHYFGKFSGLIQGQVENASRYELRLENTSVHGGVSHWARSDVEGGPTQNMPGGHAQGNGAVPFGDLPPGAKKFYYASVGITESAWIDFDYGVYVTGSSKRLGGASWEIWWRCNGKDNLGRCVNESSTRGQTVATNVPGLRMTHHENSGYPTDRPDGFWGLVTIS